MRKTQQGYFEADGSYNERPARPSKGPSVFAERGKQWFSSLPESQRQVIIWWNGLYGRNAAIRHWQIQTFIRHELGDKTPLPLVDQYNLVYGHFEEFKAWVIAREAAHKLKYP